MEAEKNHHICKRSRVGNGNGGGQEEDEEDGGGGGRRTWHQHSSRIFRVSRASGGKDRHSKVYTAKGVRDRRVRLSVSTAIQFYDLQDRLGYDQPSKAIEWLIKAAAAAISELPTLDCSFPEPPNSRPVEAKLEIEYEVGHGNGSASETSKGSVPRSESRVKARERDAPHLNSQSSFTELLTGSSSLLTATAAAQVNPSPNCVQKQIKYLPVAATADYFPHVGFFGQVQKTHQQSLGFASQALEMQQFSFFQDNPVPVPLAVAGDYNLNFSISPCLAGFNRGTLQSNSPSQRFTSPIDGSNLPFFFGAAAHSAAAAASVENHFPAGLDGRLQLYYGDEHRRSDLEGKGKS